MSAWLSTHGNERVLVPMIDLMTVVARLEQIAAEGPDHCPVIYDRLFTCDLPRLRRLLPDEALEEIAQ